MPLPESIKNAPFLSEGDRLWYAAYNQLASCRNFEGGEIPWLAIQSYANEMEFDDAEQRYLLFEVIRTVDLWFLRRLETKRKLKEESGVGKTVPKTKAIAKRT